MDIKIRQMMGEPEDTALLKAMYALYVYDFAGLQGWEKYQLCYNPNTGQTDLISEHDMAVEPLEAAQRATGWFCLYADNPCGFALVDKPAPVAYGLPLRPAHRIRHFWIANGMRRYGVGTFFFETLLNCYPPSRWMLHVHTQNTVARQFWTKTLIRLQRNVGYHHTEEGMEILTFTWGGIEDAKWSKNE